MNKKPFIKICGMTLVEDAKFAISAGADAIGFITYSKSPRYVTLQTVKNICAELPSGIQKVGVFVDATATEIDDYIAAGINTIQLHGNENADFARQCQSKAEVWKAIKPQLSACILKYLEYPAKKFLIDAFHQQLAGGTGLTVDRELAKFAIDTLPSPVILAGGLKPANFAEIQEEVQAFGLDFNSGLEISPGKKDHQKIQSVFASLER